MGFDVWLVVFLFSFKPNSSCLKKNKFLTLPSAFWPSPGPQRVHGALSSLLLHHLWERYRAPWHLSEDAQRWHLSFDPEEQFFAPEGASTDYCCDSRNDPSVPRVSRSLLFLREFRRFPIPYFLLD